MIISLPARVAVASRFPAVAGGPCRSIAAWQPRRLTQAEAASAQTVTNEVQLDAALTYLDLVRVFAALAIVVAGMYRQAGPQGGDLVPIRKTSFMAEHVAKPGEPATLLVWEPRVRHQPETWQAVKVDRSEWLPTPRDSTDGQRAAVTIAGQRHEVVFPSTAEQQMDLRTTADWVVRPRLLKVQGVAEIFILGGDRKQYQVLLDPPALLEYDVTLQQVEQALKDNNRNASGGFAIQGETERPIRVFGRLGPEPQRVLDDLRKIPASLADVSWPAGQPAGLLHARALFCTRGG